MKKASPRRKTASAGPVTTGTTAAQVSKSKPNWKTELTDDGVACLEELRRSPRVYKGYEIAMVAALLAAYYGNVEPPHAYFRDAYELIGLADFWMERNCVNLLANATAPKCRKLYALDELARIWKLKHEKSVIDRIRKTFPAQTAAEILKRKWVLRTGKKRITKHGRVDEWEKKAIEDHCAKQKNARTQRAREVKKAKAVARNVSQEK